MEVPFFSEQTLDDVMRAVMEAILKHGEQICPSQGPCRELTGVMLEINDPRSRLSRTETRGKPFSCLGELCWYLAQSNQVHFISYYVPYEEYADGEIVLGGYGPRLFNWKGQNQIENVIALLRKKPSSRQAVIQLFEAGDIAQQTNSTPCTCTLQFLIRNNYLHMITYMRSNDVFLGLPHDIFCFTMLQEIIARSLAVEVGIYKHTVGSLHLYDRDEEKARQFLSEGWQTTEMAMPPMPVGDPWAAIQSLLQAEATIRLQGAPKVGELSDIASYWVDLIRLLQIFWYAKNKCAEEIEALREKMTSSTYDLFIGKRCSPAHQHNLITTSVN